MNEFRLMGETLTLKAYQFPSGAKKLTFTLKAWITPKKFTFLQCETWNETFVQAMVEGMKIELTDYIPQTQTWTNSYGQREWKHVLVVNKFELIQEQQKQPIQQPIQQAASVPKQEFNPYQYINDSDEPDWMKELDNTPTKQVEPLSAKEVYENMTKEQETQQQFNYETLMELNKPYQHGTITKPTILATPDGTITTTEKIKVEDIE